MTDLSYTNKDGLNLYEGFDNGFDYHRDGAAEGDGYAHGGYPEITGETSDYTDTSYKTGDYVDFFHNGNVWQQSSNNPGPEPDPYVEVFKIGSLFSVTCRYDEETGEFIEWIASPDYEDIEPPITDGPGVSDYATIWNLAVYHAYWDAGDYYDSIDLSDIISTPEEITTLKVRVTCNGTQYTLPLTRDEESVGSRPKYYAGQKALGDMSYDDEEEILALWTHPFRVEVNQMSENEPRFTMRVMIRETEEDIVLENVALVKEEA